LNSASTLLCIGIGLLKPRVADCRSCCDEPRWQISNLKDGGIKVRSPVKRNKPNIAHIMVAHVAEKLPCAIVLIMAHIEDRQMFTKNTCLHINKRYSQVL
jgi:hypothetical protein